MLLTRIRWKLPFFSPLMMLFLVAIALVSVPLIFETTIEADEDDAEEVTNWELPDASGKPSLFIKHMVVYKTYCECDHVSLSINNSNTFASEKTCFEDPVEKIKTQHRELMEDPVKINLSIQECGEKPSRAYTEIITPADFKKGLRKVVFRDNLIYYEVYYEIH